MSSSSGDFKLLVLAEQTSTTAEINGDTVTNPPEPDQLTEIIAVHGLNGGHKSTWSDSSGNHWFESLIDRIPQSRVLTFQYESDISIVGWELVSPIGIWRTAIQLLKAISTDRGEIQESVRRRIIFLAQGFGGVIVKQALWIANHQHTYLPIAARTLGVVFFGTPHSATDRDSWERIVFNMAAASHEEVIDPKTLAYLVRSGPRLNITAWRVVSEMFNYISEKYEIISIFEKEVLPCLGSVVVTEEAAAWGSLNDQKKWGRNKNHRSLSKFNTTHTRILDQVFIDLSEALNDLAGTKKGTQSRDFQVEENIVLNCRERLAAVYREIWPPNISHHPETLSWIWNDKDYKLWWENNGQEILHVRGGAGAGKTTVCTVLSGKLRKDKAIVLSFFCNGSDDRRVSAEHILLSMVRQLLYYDPSLFTHIKELYDCLNRGSIWSKEDIWGLFRAMLSHPRQRFLVCLIDALDECESNAHDSSCWLLEHLAGLQQETDFPFALIFSSQCSAVKFKSDPSVKFVVLDLDDRKEIRQDIEIIVQGGISDLIREAPVYSGLENRLFEELKPLLAQPKTTSLTVKILLGVLAQPHIAWTHASLSKQMSILDVDLHSLYERALDQVSIENHSWAKKMLSWLSHSYRPLKLEELSVVSAFDYANPEALSGPLNIARDLTTVFGALVRVERDEIHLVHYSFKQFLLDHKTQNKEKWYSFDSGYTHLDIVDTCLAYLSVKGILEFHQENASFERMIELLALTPLDSPRLGLLLYASQYWPKHYQLSARVQRAPSPYTEVLKFLHKKEARTWYHINRLLDGHSSERSPFSPLIVAAKLGLPNLVAELKAKDESDDFDNQTALELAARNGHLEVVEELLDCKMMEEPEIASGPPSEMVEEPETASEHPRELQLSTALTHASELGHIKVVKTLLSVADKRRKISGSDLNLEDALSLSATYGHTEVVELLLTRGTPTNAYYKDFMPLQHAAKNGREHVVKALLTSPELDFAPKSGHNDSPLHLAAQGGYLAIVELLLSAPGAPTIDEYGLGPLNLAAEGGHLKVLNRIISESPEVVNKKTSGSNALHWAAYRGHAHVAERLIELGLSVDGTDTSDTLPLHYAAVSGHVDVVDLLLKHLKVSIDLIDSGCCTALYYAASGGHERVVQSLLKKKADPAELCGEDSPKTALHIAAEKGHIDVITELVRGGALVDQKSGGGLTPIFSASSQPAAIKRLIELGANIDAIGYNKSTPLMCAASKGNEEGVKLLLKAGANIQGLNAEGCSAMHEAAKCGSWGIVKALLTNSLSPFVQRESDKATPIDVALICGHNDLALKMVDSITEDPYWQDPFQLILSCGSDDLIELWLKRRPNDKVVFSTLGSPPLLHFAARGIRQYVYSLLDSGVDINVCDIKGRGALDVAVDPEVRRLLEDPRWHKRDGNEKDSKTGDPPKGHDGDDTAADSKDNPTTRKHCIRLGGKEHNIIATSWVCSMCYQDLTEFYYHCCECDEEIEFDLCLDCYTKLDRRCRKRDEHKLKKRYIHDRMLSFEELSPWVSEMTLPILLSPMAVETTGGSGEETGSKGPGV